MVTLDTSALFTLFDRRAKLHDLFIDFVTTDLGPFVIPVGIMAEIAYLLESRFGQRFLEQFLMDISRGDYVLDCGETDLPRILELVGRYRDFPLGYADATVIACAERHGGKVATLDLRHFGVVAGEGTIQIVP